MSPTCLFLSPLGGDSASKRDYSGFTTCCCLLTHLLMKLGTQRGGLADSGPQAGGEQSPLPIPRSRSLPTELPEKEEREELCETRRSRERVPARVLKEPRPSGLFPQCQFQVPAPGGAGRRGRRHPDTRPHTPATGGPFRFGTARPLAAPLGVSRGWTGKVTQSGRGALRASLPRSAGRPRALGGAHGGMGPTCSPPP